MDEISKATEILKKGGIVIFPTDTAFGIGCRIDDESAISRLFKIRRRPPVKATPVLVDSLSMAQKHWDTPLPDNVRRLTKKYWPGGLTVVYLCRSKSVPALVRGGSETVGVRMPDHEITLQLIRGVGVPILGPSANFHGEPTPYTFKDLNLELIKKVDFVLAGTCKKGKASTVVDCTKNPFQIIRSGAVELKSEELV